jgi:hypothetical protein
MSHCVCRIRTVLRRSYYRLVVWGRGSWRRTIITATERCGAEKSVRQTREFRCAFESPRHERRRPVRLMDTHRYFVREVETNVTINNINCKEGFFFTVNRCVIFYKLHVQSENRTLDFGDEQPRPGTQWYQMRHAVSVRNRFSHTMTY